MLDVIVVIREYDFSCTHKRTLENISYLQHAMYFNNWNRITMQQEVEEKNWLIGNDTIEV